MSRSEIPELFRIGKRISVLPIIHGSGECALLVRRWMLENAFDVVAIPLPPSFRDSVEQAVLELPKPAIVIQPTTPRYQKSEFSGGDDRDEDEDWDSDDDAYDDTLLCSYVPIDPCQPVIMAIRAAMGEHLRREYIDLETDPFLPFAAVMPDPFALRHVRPERFAAALLPSIARPPDQQTRDRILHMAMRLRVC